MPPKSPIDKALKAKKFKQPKKQTPEKSKKGKHPNSTPPSLGKPKKPKPTRKERAKIKAKAEEQKKVANGANRQPHDQRRSHEEAEGRTYGQPDDEEAAMNRGDAEQKEVAEMDHGLTFNGGENLASPQAGPSRLPISTPTPASAFTPLPRSILSGMSRRPASSPSRSLSPIPGANIVIDEKPDSAPPHTAGSHFDPPGLFSATLPAIVADTPRTDAPATGTPIKGLLLPDNVVVDGVEKDGEAEGSRGSGSMEGLHFVDDNIQKGVTRYFVEEQTEEETFLATADQSKMCQNCKRPGHRAYACPHVIVSFCQRMQKR